MLQTLFGRVQVFLALTLFYTILGTGQSPEVKQSLHSEFWDVNLKYMRGSSRFYSKEKLWNVFACSTESQMILD